MSEFKLALFVLAYFALGVVALRMIHWYGRVSGKNLRYGSFYKELYEDRGIGAMVILLWPAVLWILALINVLGELARLGGSK